MSNIKLNQCVCQKFTKAIENQKISRSEFKGLQAEILKDGYADLELSSGSANLRVKTRDLNLSAAQSGLQQNFKMGASFVSQWNRLAKDGKVSRADLSQLSKKIK